MDIPFSFKTDGQSHFGTNGAKRGVLVHFSRMTANRF